MRLIRSEHLMEIGIRMGKRTRKIGGFYTLSEHPVQEGGGVTGGVKIDFQ